MKRKRITKNCQWKQLVYFGAGNGTRTRLAGLEGRNNSQLYDTRVSLCFAILKKFTEEFNDFLDY